MKMDQIALRVSIAEDIHSSKFLRDMLQRRLSNRSKGIKNYLLTQDQRFFNALVVATYGGNPEWHPVSPKPSPTLGQVPTDLSETLGILSLTGSEKLFAVDGQHRVAGISSALKERQALAEDEISDRRSRSLPLSSSPQSH